MFVKLNRCNIIPLVQARGIFMREIKCTKDKITSVSDEDFDYLNQFKWSARAGGGSKRSWYVYRWNGRSEKPRTLYMHREIMKRICGEFQDEVDHINHNGLDNRRENLRLVSHNQNLFNQRIQNASTKTSKYKGVSWSSLADKWLVQIKYNNKTRRVSGIKNEKIAALIYDLLAIDRFEDFANLNFSYIKDIIK